MQLFACTFVCSFNPARRQLLKRPSDRWMKKNNGIRKSIFFVGIMDNAISWGGITE